MVVHALYLYGLRDREEFQIKASADLIDRVKELAPENIIVFEDIGHNRLAISKSLRENNLTDIIQLIKKVSQKRRETSKEEACAA